MKPKPITMVGDDEIAALRQAIAMYPQKIIFNQEEIKGLQHTVLRFNKHYVFIGDKIGEGNWGAVHLCVKINAAKVQSDHATEIHRTPCVIKKPHCSFFHSIKNKMSNLSNKMIDEAEINQTIYGDSEWLRLDTGDVINLLPFLGDITFKEYLLSLDKFPTIDIDFLVDICIRLTINLALIHRVTNLNNNDIKADNILLLFEKTVDGTDFVQPLKLLGVTIVDWGNATKPKVFRMPGDLRNAAPLRFYLFEKYQDEKIDIFNLGKTFLEMVTQLEKFVRKPEDNNAVGHIKNLIERMCETEHDKIPPLLGVDVSANCSNVGVFEQLKAIKEEYLYQRELRAQALKPNISM